MTQPTTSTTASAAPTATVTAHEVAEIVKNSNESVVVVDVRDQQAREPRGVPPFGTAPFHQLAPRESKRAPCFLLLQKQCFVYVVQEYASGHIKGALNLDSTAFGNADQVDKLITQLAAKSQVGAPLFATSERLELQQSLCCVHTFASSTWAVRVECSASFRLHMRRHTVNRGCLLASDQRSLPSVVKVVKHGSQYSSQGGTRTCTHPVHKCKHSQVPLQCRASHSTVTAPNL